MNARFARFVFPVFALICFTSQAVYADGVEEVLNPVTAAPQVPQKMTPIKEATSANHRVFSSEHVNLVRVAGESITDVIYDAEALEIQADKAHGVVFVRAKAGWIASGKSKTAAFFNTATHSYGLLLEALSIGPQTIEIAGTAPVKEESNLPTAPAREAMAQLTTESYIANIKELVQRALKHESLPEVEVGTAFSPKDRAFIPLAFEAREWNCNGFHFEQKKAFATRDYIIDLIEVRNLMMAPRRLALGTYAKEALGALALATGETVLPAAGVTDMVLISSRASRETREGIRIGADCLCERLPFYGEPLR